MVAADLQGRQCIRVSVTQAGVGSVCAAHDVFAGGKVSQSDPMAGFMKSDAEQINSLQPRAENYGFIAVVEKAVHPRIQLNASLRQPASNNIAVTALTPVLNDRELVL